MSLHSPLASSGQNALAAPPPRPPRNFETQAEPLQDNAVPSSSPHELIDHTLQITSWLTIFAIWGTLARLGLSALTSYPGSPIPGVAWANFAGCMVMGFLSQDQKLFVTRESSEKPAVAKAKVPLYIGLATGFCGSLTSFSSLMLDAFHHMANIEPSYSGRPTKGYNFLVFVAYLVAALSLSSCGLQVGHHIALGLDGVLGSLPHRILRAPWWAAGFLALGIWAGAILMAAFIPKWRGDALFACVFAPLGVYARFWISRWLNPIAKGFPLGTFAVNIAGSAILAATSAGRYEVKSLVGCGLLIGVADGFCGCLTTVSTFVSEFSGLGGWSSSSGGEYKLMAQLNTHGCMRSQLSQLECA